MPELSGVKKSAVLLLTLPQDEASEILKRLPPEAVEEVSREIASLGDISLTTRKDVFGESYNTALANSYLSDRGPEYAKILLTKSRSQEDAKRSMTQLTQPVQTT